MKDLIIFRGQNIYPQDIELTVELAAPQLRPGCTAAFSVEGGATVEGGASVEGRSGAGVVVVAELEQREAAGPDLLARVARQVQEQHEIPLERLVLVRRNTVPKTTSGKIQRRKCKEGLLAGGFAIVDEWRNPASLSGKDLHARVLAHTTRWISEQQRVAPESVELGASIASYGLDSIQKVELVHSLEEAFKVAIPESSFFEFETIDDLVRAVSSGGASSAGGSPGIGAPPPPRAVTQAKPSAPARGGLALPAFSAMTWEVRGG